MSDTPNNELTKEELDQWEKRIKNIPWFEQSAIVSFLSVRDVNKLISAARQVKELKRLKTFNVSVLPPEGGEEAKCYKVRATTEVDAIQLAFAIDGGWSDEPDASDILELAKSYCQIDAAIANEKEKE